MNNRINVNTRNNGNRAMVRDILVNAVNETKVDMLALTKKLGYNSKSRTVTMVKRRAEEYSFTVAFQGRYAVVTQGDVK